MSADLARLLCLKNLKPSKLCLEPEGHRRPTHGLLDDEVSKSMPYAHRKITTPIHWSFNPGSYMINFSIPLALILKSEGGDSFCNCFLDFFFFLGWSNLLIFTDFLPLLFLSRVVSSPEPLRTEAPNLPKPPKTTLLMDGQHIA